MFGSSDPPSATYTEVDVENWREANSHAALMESDAVVGVERNNAR